jgi:hypothetical protein
MLAGVVDGTMPWESGANSAAVTSSRAARCRGEQAIRLGCDESRDLGVMLCSASPVVVPGALAA